MSKRLNFFTLAEVLIVVGIIGLVAELTIPTLMEDVNITARVTSIKKTYSVLSSAYTFAVQDNGTPNNWTIGADWSADGSQKIASYLIPYLKILKNCDTTIAGCAPNVVYKELDNSGLYNYYSVPTPVTRMILADGTLLYISAYRYNNYYAMIYADINGSKPPNQIGVDTFLFEVSGNGIVPEGGPINGLYGSNSFADYCRDKTSQTGNGCTAWVLYNENMDYTKDNCTNLAWGGKTKCN